MKRFFVIFLLVATVALLATSCGGSFAAISNELDDIQSEARKDMSPAQLEADKASEKAWKDEYFRQIRADWAEEAAAKKVAAEEAAAAKKAARDRE
jgi:hypothetical protein